MPLTTEQQLALGRWAEIANERATIDEFLDWLQETGRGTVRLSMSRMDTLDAFYDTDRNPLESARRALLAEIRP